MFVAPDWCRIHAYFSRCIPWGHAQHTSPGIGVYCCIITLIALYCSWWLQVWAWASRHWPGEGGRTAGALACGTASWTLYCCCAVGRCCTAARLDSSVLLHHCTAGQLCTAAPLHRGTALHCFPIWHQCASAFFDWRFNYSKNNNNGSSNSNHNRNHNH